METGKYKPKVTNMQVHHLPTFCFYGHERPVKSIICDSILCDPVKYWCSRSKHEMDLDCDLIKIDILWPFMFVKNINRHDDPRGLDNSCIDFNRLQNIEMLEDFTELVKSLCDIPCFIRGILTIADNNDFNKFYATNWVRSTGNVKAIQALQNPEDLAFPLLKAVFTEFKQHIENMASDLMSVKESKELAKCPSCIKKSDLFKAKGNKEFSKEHFELAIKSYSTAIEYNSCNHLLYGNRALCYLHLDQFLLALADGRTATVLKQKWYKGHHRFCDALFALGRHEEAIYANIKAQKLCENDLLGLKELIQQSNVFRIVCKDAAPTSSVIHTAGQKNESNPSRPEPGASTFLINRSRKEAMNKRPNLFAESCKKTDSKGGTAISDIENTKLSSKSSTVNFKVNTVNESKAKISDGKSKTLNDSNKSREPEKLKEGQQENHNSNSRTTFSPVKVNGLREMLKVHVYNGHRALLDQCFYNAKQAFSTLLDILDPLQLKKQNVSTIDYVILIYGHASALLGIGKPEELMMAEQQLNKIIENYTKQSFNCLAFYGIGNVYLRQNRFAEAMNQFNESKILLNRKVVPGVLKWPMTSVVIEETCPEKLLVMLEKSIEECKFPPKPDGICRYLLCQGYIKKQIYFTDPDFEGFVRISCNLKCQIEFHINCWTKQKAVLDSDMDDVMEFLKNRCFTPDCMGIISSIVTYGSTGLVQLPFEENISKNKGLQKTAFKEKNTEFDKLASKQEQNSRKMLLQKEKLHFAQEIKDVPVKDENFSNEVKENAQIKICIADPVLQHIMENAELIKTGVTDTVLLMSHLMTWGVIDEDDHKKYSASIPFSFQSEVMGMLINHVGKKSNKVKIRVFLHVLNILPKIDTKLRDWLKEINNIGLRAAASFISCYADCLQKLDVGLVYKLWKKTYGIKLNSIITSSRVEVIVEYFRQASPEKVRCLVWLLEENKELFQVPALHQALDNYFTVMDCPCNILGKEEQQAVSKNGTKVKNKKRKKKQKDPEIPVALPTDVVTVTQEGTNIATNENTPLILNSSGPCAAVEKVCVQVRQWESVHYDISSIAASLEITEEEAEEIRDYLYGRFYEVLDQYGPRQVDDEILLGVCKLLPLKAQKFLEEAGGVKSFLLASVLFHMLDGKKIGLDDHWRNQDDAKKPTGDGLNKGTGTGSKMVCTDFPTVLSGANTNTCENISTGCTKQISNSAGHSEHVLFSFEDEQTTVPFSIVSHAPSVPTYHCMSVMAPASDMDILPKSSLDSGTPDHSVGPLTSKTISASKTALKTGSASKTVSPIPLKIQDEVYSKLKTNNSLSAAASSFNVAANSTKKEPKMKRDEKAILGMEDILQMKKESCEQQKQFKKGSKKSELSMSRNIDTICVVEKESQTEEIKFSDHHVNTDPFHPFEKKQGEILQMEKDHHILQGQLKETSEKYELSKTKKTEEINDVEGQLKTFTEENKVAKTELDWFYKDLENEVKKWQQEKKEHQERIRAIKSNIKKLMDSNEACVRSIEEKKQQYQKMLNDFLESSNRFENEKMKLEENIKKGKDQILETSKRAVASEVSVLENQKNVETFKLRLAISSGKPKLRFLCSVENSVSPSALPQLKSQIMSWNTYLTCISKEMENVVSQFEERIDLVKSGAKLKSLQPVLVEMPPSPPTIPVELFGWNHVLHCKGQSAPNGLTGLVGYKKQEDQDRVTVNGTNDNSVSSKHPTLSPHPWKSVGETSKSSWKHSKDSASFEEDPCIICHEELCQNAMYVLECGHRFHKLCIQTWLNTQSTCPTCRVHVLLNEDFPALVRRKRPT